MLIQSVTVWTQQLGVQEGRKMAVRSTSVLQLCPLVYHWGMDLKTRTFVYRRHDVSWNKSSFWYPNFYSFGVLFVNGHLYVIMKKNNVDWMDVWSLASHVVLKEKRKSWSTSFATNLRVLSRYMEYFYPSVHSLWTDVPRLYHSLHIIKPGTTCTRFM